MSGAATDRFQGTARPASIWPCGSALERQMSSMNAQGPPLRLVVAAVFFMFVPVGFGWLQAGGSQIPDELALLSACWSNLMPLLFPILIAVFFLPDVADEFSNGGVQAVRTRVGLGAYLTARLSRVGASAFLVVFTAVLLSCVFAFWIAPHVAPGLITPMEAGETFSSPSQRYRFAGLLNVHPLVFGLFLAGWIGVNAAAFAAAGFAALVWIPNRFVALAVPFIAYWGLTVPPAVLGQESFAASPAIFPFSLDQVPAWEAVPQLVVVSSGTVAALLLAHLRRYDTAGLS